MSNITLTLGCVLLAIASPFFFGLPLAKWLFPESDNEMLWAKAPLLGVAAIILILQNLVYLNLRLGISIFGLWVLGGLAWLWMYRKHLSKTLFSKLPYLLLIAGLAVYIIQGLGIVSLGAKYYLGRAWHDQYNYTVMTQFLMDYPFSMSLSDIQAQPYLYKGIAAAADRIGQCIFQGFLAVSALSDAKTLFEPSILLFPLLTMFAIYVLGRSFSLSKRRALLAASMSGLLPATAYIHLECFFSQAFGTPFLLIFPLFLNDLVTLPSRRRILAAAIILAAGVSCYTEFTPLFLIEAAVCVLFLFVALRFICQLKVKTVTLSLIISYAVLNLKKIGFVLLVLIGALVLNLGFLTGISTIIHRVDISGVLQGIYPYALHLKGLARLIFGDFVSNTTPFLAIRVAEGIVLIFICVAYLGLGLSAYRSRLSLRWGLFVLACVPWVIRIFGRGYSYQFYKLLLTVSPLFVLGVWVFIAEIEHWKSKICLICLHGLLILVFLCSVVATINLAYLSGFGRKLEDIDGRGGAHKMYASATRDLQDKLTKLHDQDVLIAYQDDFFEGAYLRGWLAYFARYNRVYLASPNITDISLSAWPLIPEQWPLRLHLLLSSFMPEHGRVVGQDVRLIWEEYPYLIYQAEGRDWAFINSVYNKNGLEQDENGVSFFWVGDGITEVEIFSGKAGQAVFLADVGVGPSLPESTERIVRISANQESYEKIINGAQEAFSFIVTVRVGRNIIKIQPLDKPTVLSLPNGDARPLLLMIKNLRLKEIIAPSD